MLLLQNRKRLRIQPFEPTENQRLRVRASAAIYRMAKR